MPILNSDNKNNSEHSGTGCKQLPPDPTFAFGKKADNYHPLVAVSSSAKPCFRKNWLKGIKQILSAEVKWGKKPSSAACLHYCLVFLQKSSSFLLGLGTENSHFLTTHRASIWPSFSLLENCSKAKTAALLPRAAFKSHTFTIIGF